MKGFTASLFTHARTKPRSRQGHRVPRTQANENCPGGYGGLSRKLAAERTVGEAVSLVLQKGQMPTGRRETARKQGRLVGWASEKHT